ncbi:ankyrin repeat-containing protein ITN1-like [Fagus crenata]
MCQSLLNISHQEASLVGVALIKAVKNGRVEFVTAVTNADCTLVWVKEFGTANNLFMLAVVYRQNKVFQVLCRFLLKNTILSFQNYDGNNILHMAATLEPSAKRNIVPGAAFLMQREVQWFKKVESIAQPFLLEAQNHKHQTPQELFRESHKELVKEGEKWMKETATSCTVAGALIVTIMFAAAITVPGGNNQNTGFPMFFNEKLFMLFIISDALSLLSASTSLLMFIGILTARYAEEDFLKSLPNKMIIGLSTLIFSIASMMTTFCASLFIILPGKSRMVIPLVCLAGVLVVVFAWMQFGLLIDMLISTYRPRILDKKVKRL